METKSIIITGIIICNFLFSCNKKERTMITDMQLTRNLEINYAVENFYFYEQKLPSSKEEMQKFYEENDIDSLFINNIEPEKKIAYVPIYSDSVAVPVAYYIVSTNRDIKKIKKSDESNFLHSLVTVCEYNKGKDGDILLSYGNPYLITSGRLAHTLKVALYPQWRDRVFYNVIFDIDSTTVLNKDDLDFKVQKDSITINGTFFNKKVKNKVFDELEKSKKVELQGFKTKNINEKEFVLKDVVFKIKKDSIAYKYFNEIGELENYKHIRGCDSVSN